MGIRDSIVRMASAATGNNEAPPVMQMRTGLIISVNKTPSPWECTVRLSETDVPGVTMLGWYDPVVGDVVQVIEQGPMRFILGTAAPGKVYMPPVPPPAPPAPPAAPPAALPVREVPVAAVGAGTGPSEGNWNNWRSDAVYQTGGSIAQRGFYFYGAGIAAAKGAGTILGGTIFIKRSPATAGVGGGANVRLGAHVYETQPGGIPGSHSNVSVVGQLTRDQGKTFTIPQSIIDGMNAGIVKGLGLEPGAMGYLSADYLIAFGTGAGREWSGALSLTVQG